MEGQLLILGLILVSILWGITNPLLKRASVGIEEIKAPNSFLQVSCYFLNFILVLLVIFNLILNLNSFMIKLITVFTWSIV